MDDLVAKGCDGESRVLARTVKLHHYRHHAQWQQSIAFPPDKTFADAAKKLVTRGAGRQRDVTRDATPEMIIALR
ncbi:hypothetical protein [Mesorhizobium sp. M5C.F.Ca.IN.020.32.2.1]|uniref:hypothetical protein n=1 Tax=Mesorhizobium sp. M5C.F.Ca.IN.020.32.2.1 TaxID=2496771 RepID=UPI0032AF2FC4